MYIYGINSAFVGYNKENCPTYFFLRMV